MKRHQKQGRLWLWLLGGLFIGLLLGCTPAADARQPSSNKEEAQSQAMIEITGRLGVIRNGHTQYRLYADDGMVYRLEIPESVLQKAGGVLALQDGKIRVKGTLESQEGKKVISVSEIERIP